MFTLKLLGSPSLEGDDGLVAGRPVQRRRMALLAILALAKAGCTRDQLIPLLWPDTEPDRARHLLTDSIHVVNEALGADAILASGDAEFRINAAVVDVDVYRFEHALATRDLEQAADLYAGPLLEGLHVPGSPEFDRWLNTQRERLARSYRGVLESLAKQRAENGDPQGAADAWQRLANEDPLNSWVATRLMLALDAAGQRAAALEYARVHAALLREEFGTEADPEVAALAARLQAAHPLPSHPSSPAAPVSQRAGPPPQAPELPLDRKSTRRSSRVAALVAGAGLVVLGGVWALDRSPETAAPKVDPAAIAVLPFEDRSPNGDSDYFGDGMTDELINALSKVEGLRVTARTSSFAFKGTNKDVREIARQLGVGAVLEGSVRQAGNRLRVTAQLTNAADGYNLWSETYERQVNDVFAIQNEISQAIVRALEVELAGRRSQPLVRRGTNNLDAYTLYLKGRYFWNERVRNREQNLRRSIANYEAALKADPSFARAHAGLADSYASLAGHIPREQAYRQAKTAALRALELDETSADAHRALARLLVLQEWDWAGAEPAYRRALALQPGDATTHQWYGMYLVSLGQIDRGIAELNRARELDPLSVGILLDLGRASYYARKPEQAIQHLESALELEPTSADAHLYIGLSHLEARSWDQARAAFQRWAALTGEEPAALLAYVDAVSGRRAEAQRALQALQAAQAADSEVSPASLAVLYAALGQPDAAFTWLERSIEERSPFVLFLKVNPRIDPLRADPRFAQLLRRVNLPT